MNFVNNINLFTNCERYMLLKIHVNNDDVVLKNAYINAAKEHNKKMMFNPFPDAGFDLLSVKETFCNSNEPNKVNFEIKCAASMICESGKTYPTGFYIYPRSSTGSKTPLRLSNSVGIIDSGYRGNLMAFFDIVYSTSKNINFYEYTIPKNTKLVQVCAPSLVPIYVEIVEQLDEETMRGSGGFGSTGV